MIPSVDMIVDALLYGVLIPAAVTLATLIFVALCRRRGQSTSPPQTLTAEKTSAKGRIAGTLAAALGLVSGWVALVITGQLSWDFLNLTDSRHWLLPLTLLALAINIVAGYSRSSITTMLFRLGCAWVIARILVDAEAAIQPIGPGWYSAVGVAVFCLWGLLDIATERWAGVGFPVLLTLIALGMGALLEFAGILMFAQMSGVLAAVLASCSLFAWLVPSAACRGMVPAVAVLVPGLLFVGYRNHFSEVPPTCFLLVLAAPLLLGMTVCLAPKEKPGWLWKFLAIAVTLIPLVTAITLAALAEPLV